MTGDVVLAKIREMNPTLRVIMITAFGDVDTAVAAMKLGACEFLEKPVDLSVLLDRIRQAEQALAVDEDVAVVEEAVEESPLPLNIVAKSHAMKDVLSLVRRMAGSQWPVLISGETGTGKAIGGPPHLPFEPQKRSPFSGGQLRRNPGESF
jgi:DNA-binding NtrC family response regulator